MDKIYNKVATDLNVPPHIVKQVYQDYWDFIKDKISSFTKETIKDEPKKSFNLIHLGKLTINKQYTK